MVVREITGTSLWVLSGHAAQPDGETLRKLTIASAIRRRKKGHPGTIAPERRVRTDVLLDWGWGRSDQPEDIYSA